MVAASRPLRPALDAHVVGRRMTGNETYVLKLAEALGRREDADPVVYVDEGVSWPGDGRVETRALRWREPYLRIPVELPLRVRADRADLLHVQYVAPPLIRVPVVTAIHDLSFEDVPGLFRRPTELRLKTFVRLSARRSAAIVTVSEFTRSRVIELYRIEPERVHVTYNGVDPEWRRLPDDVTASRLRPLDLPGSFVLAVGNLHPRKNIARLVSALAEARAAGVGDIHLVLAGQPGWRANEVDEAVARVAGDRWVHRLGYVEKPVLVALHSAASAVAYVSLYEGFGLPVLEALAVGCVVVASGTTSIPEVAGDAARLVDPASQQSITEGLIAALTDGALRERLAVAGPRRAQAFTWEACADATMRAYRHALGQVT